MHVVCNLIGETADRFEEFEAICKRQGISVETRINTLILGDILIYEKLIKY